MSDGEIDVASTTTDSISSSNMEHNRSNAPTIRLPNLPEPRNGQIKTYADSKRTFTRPYSAKTVFFYKEGDEHFSGVRLPISKSRYRSFEALLDELNRSIPMPFGVRRLTTPYGRTPIERLDQLQHLGKYIASSSSRITRPLNMAEIERIQKNPVSPSFKAKLRMSRQLGLLPNAAKQILFVLNGHPSRIYRCVINPNKTLTFNSLLQEISEAFQTAIFKLYSFSGQRLVSLEQLLSFNEARVLACGRKERPAVLKPGPLLPPIPPIQQPGRLRTASDTEEATTSSSSGKHTDDPLSYPIENNNSIEGKKKKVKSPQLVNTRNSMNIAKRRTTLSSPSKRMKRVKGPVKAQSQEQEIEEAPTTIEDLEHDVNTAGTANGERRTIDRQNGERQTISSQNAERRTIGGQNGERQTIGRQNGERRTSREHRAATTIQRHIRGHLARNHVQELRRTQPQFAIDEDEEAEEGLSLQQLEPDQAATVIQANYRGYLTRKRMDEEYNRKMQAKEKKKKKKKVSKRSSKITKRESSRMITAIDSPVMTTNDYINYTVTVYTGNRWAADTGSNLYIVIYGDLGNSGRQTLTQDETQSKFKQNQIDSFHMELINLGLLTKLDIGHETVGYGAGVFIDRVCITENIVDGRQFLFQCNKWLDSGQVDGKLERTLLAAAYFHLGSIPDDDKQSNGRWELLIKTGDGNGRGQKLGNFSLTAYGTNDVSEVIQLSESQLSTDPNTSLVQVDFGDIGDLIKIRVEIEEGTQDFYLDSIRLIDLDTAEQMFLNCGQWLTWRKSTKKDNGQPFRELAAFRAGIAPSPLLTYQGRLCLASGPQYLVDSICQLQLFGDEGETGLLAIDCSLTDQKKDKTEKKEEIVFKMDAVSIGRLQFARLFFTADDYGCAFYEGLSVLQSIWDKLEVSGGVSTSREWIVSSLSVRDSTHSPYRYLLGLNRLPDFDDSSQQHNYKDLFLQEIEGLSTKKKKNSSRSSLSSTWRLSMTLPKTSKVTVTLCFSSEDLPMQSVGDDDDNTFELVTKGDIKKMRLQLINLDQEGDDQVLVQRLHLHDTINGDEIWFPDCRLRLDQPFELALIWPDIPPEPSLIYVIRMNTDKVQGDFTVSINLIGENGESGRRKLTDSILLKTDKDNEFRLEAISLGTLTGATLTLESNSSNAQWTFSELTVIEGNERFIFEGEAERRRLTGPFSIASLGIVVAA